LEILRFLIAKSSLIVPDQGVYTNTNISDGLVKVVFKFKLNINT